MTNYAWYGNTLKVLLTAHIFNKSVAGAAKDLTESVKPFLV